MARNRTTIVIAIVVMIVPVRGTLITNSSNIIHTSQIPRPAVFKGASEADAGHRPPPRPGRPRELFATEDR